MNKFTEWLIQFLTTCINILFPFQKSTAVVKTNPTPPTNVVKGLLSMNLHIKDQVEKVFSNPLVIGALKGTVDVGSQFKLPFPCFLHLNTNQKVSWVLVDGGLRIDFDQMCPVLEAQAIFDLKMDVNFLFIDRNHLRISLVGAPDYIVNFV